MSKIQNKEPPKWLTEDFLKTSLETDRDNFAAISITSFTAEPAVAPGNNYGSNMFRAFIKYRRDLDQKSISLIVKAPLTGGIIESLEDGGNYIYEREIIYYSRFISETYRLIKHSIVPKHYPSPHPLCLVMEDLKSSGYSMVDRHQLLDFDHCRLYIEASARLHALSVAVNKTSPDVIQSILKEPPQVQEQIENMSRSIIMKALRSMVAYLEDKPDCEKYSNVINQVVNNFSAFWEIYLKMEKQKRRIKAVIQGDPWCTNMMFKYDKSGNVTEVKLLDFQNLKFTTPVFEFITFFWLSVQPEVRERKANDLYHLYCDSLNTNLANLGCSERLSFEDLKTEIISLSPLVLSILCSLLPICIYDGVADMNQIIAEDTSNRNIKETLFYSLYSGPAFDRFYPQILKHAETEGMFKYLAENFK